MKKWTAFVLIAVLLVAAVVFGVLWQRALHDDSDITALARSGAGEAYARFSDFREKGYDSDYWGGVAAFRVFQEAYAVLSEGENASADRILCSEIYGSLLIYPESAKTHIADIVEVMRLLSEDIADENCYVRMSELRNALQN